MRHKRRLFACCSAVVVFPHHLAPSIKTAPLPLSLRSNILSAIQGRYIFNSDIFKCFYGYKVKTLILQFGYLAQFYSVVWIVFIPLIGGKCFDIYHSTRYSGIIIGRNVDNPTTFCPAINRFYLLIAEITAIISSGERPFSSSISCSSLDF